MRRKRGQNYSVCSENSPDIFSPCKGNSVRNTPGAIYFFWNIRSKGSGGPSCDFVALIDKLSGPPAKKSSSPDAHEAHVNSPQTSKIHGRTGVRARVPPMILRRAVCHRLWAGSQNRRCCAATRGYQSASQTGRLASVSSKGNGRKQKRFRGTTENTKTAERAMSYEP